MTGLGRRLTTWDSLLGVATILLFLWAAWRTPGFLTEFNLTQAASGISERALIALPMALLIIAREIDISVASTLALASVVMGISIRAGHPLAVSLLLPIVIGVLAGLLNGILVTRLGLPALVVTLGTMALFRGVGYVMLGSGSVNVLPPTLDTFGIDNVPHTPVPWTIVPFLVAAPFFVVALHRSMLGRRVYAIGGEPAVARYSGVNVNRIRIGLFVATAVMAAIAGIVLTARTANARANNAIGLELDVITVVFLGGVSMTGGRGRLTGVIWALVLIGLVRNVMTLNLTGGDDQGTVIGLILIGALLLNTSGHRVAAQLHRRRLARRLTHPPTSSSTSTTTITGGTPT